METPICDFVRKYADKDVLRLHMPGHKGTGVLGIESLDITEIDGADVLYHGNGIIRRSENNAASMFGAARTLYSAEGSSLSIRAMLCLVALYAKSKGKPPRIAAGRNAHKVFMTASALLDLDVDWIFPEQCESIVSCKITDQYLDEYLSAAREKPSAVYITSPDYLGNIADIKALSAVCRRHGVLLLVDNAHGSYLHFLPESLHPLTLGADLCCDSAHKTLPVLTGGGYLHISASAPDIIRDQAETAMSLFASTSPSYLILQSLDAANRYLAEGYRERLAGFIRNTDKLKGDLYNAGYTLVGDEPLKLTVKTKPYGYTGYEFAETLAKSGLICEFSDPDYVCMMFTPEIGVVALPKLRNVMLSIPKKEAITDKAPPMCRPKFCCSPREALFSGGEIRPLCKCEDSVFAGTMISCPPAIPIVVCGEIIDNTAIRLMKYYGITECRVIPGQK